METLCEVMSRIGETLKHYNGEILEEMNEEEDIAAEIESNWEINRVIGIVKRGFKPSELSESSSLQTAMSANHGIRTIFRNTGNRAVDGN